MDQNRRSFLGTIGAVFGAALLPFAPRPIPDPIPPSLAGQDQDDLAMTESGDWSGSCAWLWDGKIKSWALVSDCCPK